MKLLNMRTLRILVDLSGATAFILTIVTLTFVIAFAVALAQANLIICVPAVVAAVFGVVSIATILLLCYQYLSESRYDSIFTERARLPRFAGILCASWMVAAIVTLAWMQIIIAKVPKKVLGTATKGVLAAAFALWGLSLLAQVVLLVLVAHHTRIARQQTCSLRTEHQRYNNSKMQVALSPQFPRSRGTIIVNPPLLDDGFASDRKPSDSETISALRSSLTQVVRPISSKTRLISLKTSIRSPSLDSGIGERPEDGFESWDTSNVDMRPPWIASSSASLTQGRFLETIPASPVGSRSPSPGFPLDLPPLPSTHSIRRSQSHSPATSTKDVPRLSGPASPTGSEGHIHPLFRTDSPEPPPTITPGTTVTAAPHAGQLITDRKNLNRMRSGSMPASPSPLAYSKSTDNVSEGTETDEKTTVSLPEREMTPPIPDWVLDSSPRSSFNGYSRRKPGPSLNAVGSPIRD